MRSDFYGRQARARRRTGALLLAFLMAVAAVVLALDVVIFTIVEYEPRLALACSLAVLAVILVGSSYRSMQLLEGGGAVARSLGGVRLDRNAADPQRRRLENVVEEMAIASGVPMPEIYVLEQESGINAFAAGLTSANAAVAVTQGAVERLDRDELQGVIAHEFSHILNGDMRLNLRMVGWVFGLMMLGQIGRIVLRHAPRARRGAGPLLLLAAAAVVIGWLGQLAGRILQAAVSRQRERLADASAVQFTRDPDGLKGALLKIAGLGTGSRIAAAGVDEVAHMLFAPGTHRIFATHPPLAERIRALDPGFDTDSLPAMAAAALRRMDEISGQGADAQSISHAMPATRAAVPADPAAIAALTGRPDTMHVAHARALRLALPESLRNSAGSGGRARALVLAVLLSGRAAVRVCQLNAIERALGAGERAAVEGVAPAADALAPFLRLPAVLQLFPSLRRLPRTERQDLLGLIADLARADARIEVFEYCLTRLLVSALRDELHARVPHGGRTLAGAAGELQVLFSVLAQQGAADERLARQAYEAGMHRLLPRQRPGYAPREDWPMALDAALERLERLHPYAKEALIEALVCTLAHDGLIGVAEAELLRTICTMLHCPLPPLLGRGPGDAGQ